MADAETMTVLKSIDDTLKALLARTVIPPPAAASTALTVASDVDLDGTYGNPVIKAKDPRDWTGEPMTGKRFSECPAEYLILLADRLEYFARKADETNELTTSGKPKSHYNRLDAARARGWAKRIRDGYVPPVAAADGWSSDVGF